MNVVGLDIGTNGAVAVLDESGELLEVYDMPVLCEGPKGRPGINAPLLVAIIAGGGCGSDCLYRVAWPEAHGWRCAGLRLWAGSLGGRGVLAAHGVPVAFPTPPQWTRLVGIAAGKAEAKDVARSAAIRRWPGKASLFALKNSDGRVEASLISLAGITREGRPRGLETTFDALQGGM